MRRAPLALAARDFHAWLPWLLAATFLVATETLARRAALSAPERALLRAPVWSTVILLLAIRRHWSHSRAAFEWVTFGALAPAAWLVGRSLGGPAQSLPLLAVGSALPGYAAWRFAPDCGQHGYLWTLRAILRRPLVLLTAAALALLFLNGCTPPAPPTALPTPQSPATSATPTAPVSHPLRGEILRVDPARQILVVQHDEIPGYMPAMAMPFHVPGADFATLRPGQFLTALLRKSSPGEFTLDQLQILPPAPAREIDEAAQALHADTTTRGRRAFRELGESAPSFSLYNQDGAVVRFDQFRGQRVVLNFIFTRCPIPKMCPAATAKMIALQTAAKKAGHRDLHFVSISFDAAYDTPPVLKKYAADRGIDTTNFSFLTGPESAIADLLRQFGVITIPRENLYLHTVSTILIGADGQLLFRTEEPDWAPDDFLSRL